MPRSSLAVKKSNFKAYLSLCYYGFGWVRSRGSSGSRAFYFAPRAASELCRLRQPIGLKSAFFPKSDRFIGENLISLSALSWVCCEDGALKLALSQDGSFPMQWEYSRAILISCNVSLMLCNVVVMHCKSLGMAAEGQKWSDRERDTCCIWKFFHSLFWATFQFTILSNFSIHYFERLFNSLFWVIFPFTVLDDSIHFGWIFNLLF